MLASRMLKGGSQVQLKVSNSPGPIALAGVRRPVRGLHMPSGPRPRVVASAQGIVFEASTADERCDNMKVAGPVVRHDGEKYLMWYYCQGTTSPFTTGIPLGNIALATSEDGLSWTRQQGPLAGGAVMVPSWDDVTKFDGAMLGCSDVIRVGDEWWMYYSGGAQPGSPFAGAAMGGFPMRAGLAKSSDGFNWTRVVGDGPGGCIVDIGGEGEFDEKYIGWPSVIQQAPDKFLMVYHSATFDLSTPGTFSAFFELGTAVSNDGVKWTKRGPCTITGSDPSEDAFNSEGLGTRDVVLLPSGELVMYAEGVNKQGQHNIAAFRSQDDGMTWNVCNQGKALIEPEAKNMNVGTACVVRPNGDDSDDWWVYCVKTCSVEGQPASFRVGLAQSEAGPEGPFQWV